MSNELSKVSNTITLFKQFPPTHTILSMSLYTFFRNEYKNLAMWQQFFYCSHKFLYFPYAVRFADKQGHYSTFSGTYKRENVEDNSFLVEIMTISIKIWNAQKGSVMWHRLLY